MESKKLLKKPKAVLEVSPNINRIGTPPEVMRELIIECEEWIKLPWVQEKIKDRWDVEKLKLYEPFSL